VLVDLVAELVVVCGGSFGFRYGIFLLFAGTGFGGSHFHPSSDLFLPSEKKDVITYAACWIAKVVSLVGLGSTMGPIPLLLLHGVT